MPDSIPPEPPEQLDLDLNRRTSTDTTEPEQEEKVRVIFGFGVNADVRKRFSTVFEDVIHHEKGQMPLIDHKAINDKDIYVKKSEAKQIRDNIAQLLGVEYVAVIGEDSFNSKTVLKINMQTISSEPPIPEYAPGEEPAEKKEPEEDDGYNAFTDLGYTKH